MSSEDTPLEHDQDYIFRFRLEEGPALIYANRLAEMVRQQLAALLDVVVLTRGSQEVKIDGFKFLGDPGQIYSLWKGQFGSSDEAV